MSQARPPRRLEVGDWVRLPASPAVGKIVDVEFDLEDDHLRGALVEAEGRTTWRAIGPLVRVTPEEEATLVEAARARGLLTPKAASLVSRLAEFRAGTLRFVRSPGLLDLLWARSTRADPRGVPEIEELLDHAAAALAPWCAPGRPARATEEVKRVAAPPVVAPRVVASLMRVEPVEVPGPLPPDVDPSVCRAIVEALDAMSLRWVAEHQGLRVVLGQPPAELVASILDAPPAVRDLVLIAPTSELRVAARRLGLAEADGVRRLLRAKLIERAEGI